MGGPGWADPQSWAAAAGLRVRHWVHWVAVWGRWQLGKCRGSQPHWACDCSAPPTYLAHLLPVRPAVCPAFCLQLGLSRSPSCRSHAASGSRSAQKVGACCPRLLLAACLSKEFLNASTLLRFGDQQDPLPDVLDLTAHGACLPPPALPPLSPPPAASAGKSLTLSFAASTVPTNSFENLASYSSQGGWPAGWVGWFSAEAAVQRGLWLKPAQAWPLRRTVACLSSAPCMFLACRAHPRRPGEARRGCPRHHHLRQGWLRQR